MSEVPTIIVIGGGMAGVACADRLLAGGLQVVLLERRGGLVAEASGNPQAIVMPYLRAQADPVDRFYQEAFRRTREVLATRAPAGAWEACGVVQLATGARKLRWRDKVACRGLDPETVRVVGAGEASSLLGFEASLPGLHYPTAGWLDPVAVGHALLAHRPRLITCFDSEVAALERDTDGVWQLQDAAGRSLAGARQVVVAAGSTRLGPLQRLPLTPVRGQLTRVPATPGSLVLQRIALYDGYILPAARGYHSVGATFDRDRRDATATPEDHQRNLAALESRLPGLFQALAPRSDQLLGRVGFRAATPDHLPLVGSLTGPLEGLHLSVGHGSRGMVTAWLAADILAAAITGGEPPVDQEVVGVLHPGRYR